MEMYGMAGGLSVTLALIHWVRSWAAGSSMREWKAWGGLQGPAGDLGGAQLGGQGGDGLGGTGDDGDLGAVDRGDVEAALLQPEAAAQRGGGHRDGEHRPCGQAPR
ncbi:hypothetical protein GCM10020219_099400 [Nonomuraea dietziae]